MASATGTTDRHGDTITMYGAAWCVDCRNAQAVLQAEAAAYDYVDLMADESAATTAEEISGQKHIPVVVFPDGVFYVEPTKAELALKIRSLSTDNA
ncbi:MAG: NrdH-redoxin [Propionibacteriaceae bacterium]|jgi:glutaredoxin|nr:NrdH-redoxin [Propionibacteriaceae bacterium]